MGVKLSKFITGKEINELTFEKKQYAAIDAYNLIMIYIKKSFIPGKGYMTDASGQLFSHLYDLIYLISRLLKNNIIPIFCYDGSSHELKIKNKKYKIRNLEQRNTEYILAKERYQKYIEKGSTMDAKRIAMSKEYLFPNCIFESKFLLQNMGISFLESISNEGEALCSQLVKDGRCNFTISRDFDSLLYGSNKFFYMKPLKQKKINGTMYDLNSILRQINLKTLNQLIDLSIIIGNDYTKGIYGIGIKKGIKLLEKYNDIEGIYKKSTNQYIVESKKTFKLELIEEIR